jgi:hypothetical protein
MMPPSLKRGTTFRSLLLSLGHGTMYIVASMYVAFCLLVMELHMSPSSCLRLRNYICTSFLSFG